MTRRACGLAVDPAGLNGLQRAVLPAGDAISLRCPDRWLAQSRSGGPASLTAPHNVRRRQRLKPDPQPRQHAGERCHQRLHLRHIAWAGYDPRLRHRQGSDSSGPRAPGQAEGLAPARLRGRSRRCSARCGCDPTSDRDRPQDTGHGRDGGARIHRNRQQGRSYGAGDDTSSSPPLTRDSGAGPMTHGHRPSKHRHDPSCCIRRWKQRSEEGSPLDSSAQDRQDARGRIRRVLPGF